VEQAYFPIGTELSGSNFYVRFRGTPESAFRSIRAILRNTDPTLQSLFSARWMSNRPILDTERMLAALPAASHAGAPALVGWPVRCDLFRRDPRTREIGIRLALGATRLSTIWLVLRDAMVDVAAGTAIALPCVWAFGPFC